MSSLMRDGRADEAADDSFTAPEVPAYQPPTSDEAEVGRVAQAIERLSDRIDTAETRQALAITGVERSVRQVIERVDAGEREQMAASARFEGAVNEVSAAAERLAQRLQKIEDEAVGPRSAEALQALEAATKSVTGQLVDADQRSRAAFEALQARVERLDAAEDATHRAIRELREACSALDGRMAQVEETDAARIEVLAHSLTAQVESVREELARDLSESAEARFQRIEQAFAKVNEQVRSSEQRQTAALGRMGREVLDAAQALSQRVRAVERRSEATAERVSNDTTRIVGALEDRLARADAVQALALEQLGVKIARITSKLAERIETTERRTAYAIDDVGEQVARVTERIGERHMQSVSDLADRIRDSEARTARLLEEARAKIDARLGGAAPPPPEDAGAALAETPAFLLARPAALATASDEPAADEPVQLEPNIGFDTDEPAPMGAIAEVAPDLRLQGPAPIGVDDLVAEAPLAPAAIETDIDLLEARGETDCEDEIDEEDDLLAELLDERTDRADAARWDAAIESATMSAPDAEATGDEAAGEALTTAEVIERARAAAQLDERRVRPFPSARRDTALLARRRGGGRVTGGLMVASLVAAVGVSASGYLLFQAAPPSGAGAGAHLAKAKAAPSPTTPLVAVALAPRPIKAVDSGELTAAYASAMAKIAGDDERGVPAMRKLAEGGYAPAQFYLSGLYHDGKAGVAKDAVQYRHWLELAAAGGDLKAMHNLALAYHDGVGGSRSAAAAASWFQRAAELGWVDSQYNLAALYEHGDGVAQNLGEAYKWYLIAGHAGDFGASAAAARVGADLSHEGRAAAEGAASAFRTTGVPTPAAAVPTPPAAAQAARAAASPWVAMAQRGLSRLGYYQGPADGVPSAALRMALTAYQREKGLPATGQADRATLARLKSSAG